MQHEQISDFEHERAKKQVDVTLEVGEILLEKDGIESLLLPNGMIGHATPEGNIFRRMPWHTFGIGLYTVDEWIDYITKDYVHYLGVMEFRKRRSERKLI